MVGFAIRADALVKHIIDQECQDMDEFSLSVILTARICKPSVARFPMMHRIWRKAPFQKGLRSLNVAVRRAVSTDNITSLLKNPKGWWYVIKEEEAYVRKGNDHDDGNKGAQCRPIEQHFT